MTAYYNAKEAQDSEKPPDRIFDEARGTHMHAQPDLCRSPPCHAAEPAIMALAVFATHLHPQPAERAVTVLYTYVRSKSSLLAQPT